MDEATYVMTRAHASARAAHSNEEDLPLTGDSHGFGTVSRKLRSVMTSNCLDGVSVGKVILIGCDHLPDASGEPLGRPHGFFLGLLDSVVQRRQTSR